MCMPSAWNNDRTIYTFKHLSIILSNKVKFILSEIKLCCGVFGGESWDKTPLLLR